MKMKEVCIRTGLTEKSVRLYIEQELIHPECVQVKGRNQFTFTESDILELEKIHILREADFSISEIREMQQNPACVARFVEKKKIENQKSLSHCEKLDVLLQRLGPSELGNLEAVSQTLEPIKNVRKGEPQIARRFLYITIIVLLLFLVSLFGYGKMGCVFLLLFWGSGFGFVGIVGVYMSIRYLLCEKRAQKMQHKGVGTIVHVCEERRIDEAFARGGKTQSTFSAAGIGGIGTLLLMIWNEIRLDCYFPVVQYTNENGELTSASYPYGAFRHDITRLQSVEIAWNSKDPHIVYPIKADWLTKKGIVYLGLSSILLVLCGCSYWILL